MKGLQSRGVLVSNIGSSRGSSQSLIFFLVRRGSSSPLDVDFLFFFRLTSLSLGFRPFLLCGVQQLPPTITSKSIGKDIRVLGLAAGDDDFSNWKRDEMRRPTGLSGAYGIRSISYCDLISRRTSRKIYFHIVR